MAVYKGLSAMYAAISPDELRETTTLLEGSRFLYNASTVPSPMQRY